MLAFFHAAQFLASSLKGFGHVVITPLFWLTRFFYRYLLLPAYSRSIKIRQAWQKMFSPAKNKFLYALIARPLLHIVVVLLIFTVTAANLHARTLPSAGEGSILFSLVGNDDVELIEETASYTRPASSLSYFGPGYGLAGQTTANSTAAQPANDRLALVTSGGSAVSLSPAPTGAIRELKTVRAANRTEVETYVVQDGDTVSTIAQEFNVKISTILWANNLGSNDYIRPGQSLKILPVDGIMYTIKKGDTLSKLAALYEVSETTIREQNGLEEDQALSLDLQLLLPGASLRVSAPTPTRLAQTPVINRITNALKQPVSSPNSGSGSMIWPTSGHVITQYWGWRHTGLDIDGHYDSPIYASDTGKVEIAGWGTGYGIQAVVNHENGFKTRYGHMSKIFVTPGQKVAKGEVIGMVGTTGRSTGTHLHFEIYVKGTRVNPLLYVR
ncbi:MAG: peptidoglycan DD-metalloendopeptidase family protein [Parcubacteria group bacterium]|nr:peptidoglycan DD-metalloendopeptidase family protein [Parcubacteria group bacterium]